MAFPIDRTLSAKQNFVNLINTVILVDSSTGALTVDDVTLSNVVSYTPSDASENTNTQITVTANTDSGFTGTTTLRYLRLTLGQTVVGARTQFSITSSDTTTTLLESISQEHNLLTSQVTLSGSLPTTSGASTTMTVTAVADGAFYVPASSFTVIVTLA